MKTEYDRVGEGCTNMQYGYVSGAQRAACKAARPAARSLQRGPVVSP